MNDFSLAQHGITNVKSIARNFPTSRLYGEIIRRKEGVLASTGPIIVNTGKYTGRSPDDKFIVEEASSKENIWWGDVNRSISETKFKNIYYKVSAYLQNKDVFVQDCYAGASEKHKMPIRVITEDAWHSLFARNMFIPVKDEKVLHSFEPRFTVINVPNFKACPELDSTNSEAFVLVHFEKGLVLIGGTSYAGEIKKSIFTILNYVMPLDDILSMHCSANVGKNNDVSLFFGLSGTGKTTLSASPDRRLIGDDEHAWGKQGIFNFEGGCYAKAIRLSKESEPEIYECSRKFGTILENVEYDRTTREVDFDDGSLTENTRSSYPITHLSNVVEHDYSGHPNNLFMLTCDAFGVMPPIARLTPEQAMYYFLSGYTAKVAGTERGMGKQPQATFSSCFGAPFMALNPTIYAELLGTNIAKHKVKCWLLNTGWSGGPYGVGKRLKISYSRAMVSAALSGELDKADFTDDPIFGFEVPLTCSDVPPDVLAPKNTWKDKDAYDKKVLELASSFQKNFVQFAEHVSKEISEVGPKI